MAFGATLRMGGLKRSMDTMLFIFYAVFVLKCSSANRVKKTDSELVKKNLEGFERQDDHESSKRAMIYEVDRLILANRERDRQLKVKRRKFSSLSGLDKDFFVRQQLKKEGTNDRITSQGTRKGISEPQEILPPEVYVTISKDTSLQFNDVLNRLSSKLRASNYKKDAVNLDQTSTQNNQRYNEIVSSRHVVKRNVNTTQSSAPSTTNPLSISLPPPPLRPPPLFNITPVCSGYRSCSGRCMGNGTDFRSDENLACYCDTVCYEIFNDCCADYTKYCGVQKRGDITVKKFNWTCEPFGHFKSNQQFLASDGIWVISRCADDWSFDKTRSNCEDLTSFLRQASDISRYIPAVSGNLTFGTFFCESKW